MAEIAEVGGTIVIREITEELPQIGQLIAQPGHSCSHDAQTRACSIAMANASLLKTAPSNPPARAAKFSGSGVSRRGS
jgi:hypothetical protein